MTMIKLGGGSSVGWKIAVFLLIYAPVLNFGVGALGDTLSLMCALIIIYYWFISNSVPKKMLPEIKNLAILLGVTIGYGLVGSLLFSSEQGSLQVALRPLRALLMFLGVYYFVLAYANRFNGDFSDALISDIFLSITIHSLIMIAQFFSPEFRNALYPFTNADQVLEYNQEFRMAGLTSGGGSQLSVFQSIGLLLWPFLLVSHNGIRQTVVINLCALCIAGSLVLSGRSGIVLAGCMLPLALFFSQKNGFQHLMGWVVKAVLLAALLFGIIHSAYMIEIDSIENWNYAETALTRSFDFINSDEPLSQHSTFIDLREMFILPESATTFIFGDPHIFEASYLGEYRILNSDVGYVVFLFGYGLIGSFIQYLFYVLIIYYSAIYLRYNRNIALISVIWAFALLIYHLKEVFVFTRIGFSLTVMFISALAIERYRHVCKLKTNV